MVLTGLLFLSDLILLPPLVTLVFPLLMESGDLQLRAHFLESLGIGTITALLLPFFLFLLIVSTVGIPLALGILPFVLVAFVVGNKLRQWMLKRMGTKRRRTRSKGPAIWTIQNCNFY